jgi:outer membrane protein assembly factor BamD
VKAKYAQAVHSVLSRRAERFRDAVDECYAFKNEYPESTNIKDVDEMLEKSEKILKDLPEDDEYAEE